MEEMRDQINQLTGAVNALTMRNGEYERELTNMRARLNSAANSAGTQEAVDLFKIPDPIKSIPAFDGSKKQLPSWLALVEKTLNYFEDAPQLRKTVYFEEIVKKLTGKARDIVCLAGQINDLEELKRVLNDQLGDKQDLSTYKCQLWHNRMDGKKTIHDYYKNTLFIIQKIKTISKQDPVFGSSWTAISKFIEADGLAAFIAGLRAPHFGYVQSAKPASIEEAYAFLCKFESAERISSFHPQVMTKPQAQTWQKPNQKSFPQKGEKQNRPLSPNQEPMEVDKSIRSRLTYNKKLDDKMSVHNIETPWEKEDENEEEEEKEDFEVNFCQDPGIPYTT